MLVLTALSSNEDQGSPEPRTQSTDIYVDGKSGQTFRPPAQLAISACMRIQMHANPEGVGKEGPDPSLKITKI